MVLAGQCLPSDVALLVVCRFTLLRLEAAQKRPSSYRCTLCKKTFFATQGLACKAVSSDGHLIGVIANSVKCKFDKHGDDAEDDTKFQHITKFLNKIGKETNFFYQYPNVCRALTIDILSVDDKYRGKGVCKSLMDKARELALKNRCSMIYVGCSSYFSAKAAERLGFQCIYTMSYEDYLNDKGQQMFNPPTPHTHFKVYVLPLDND
ncbi:arylalkylamine N-acetyltransferase 1-like isoform X3 [Adelges cooleyi]|uniref:arylalkylamine N-acetyltransferase 1-like isoform X3 n=1 Tax=Adelges cooleyi TaxID=133065 RepID=UPI0021805CA0|nr:arylalkylamine N-acetyltransferase 1-like isoform X3 [Adelges cooleyi]